MSLCEQNSKSEGNKFYVILGEDRMLNKATWPMVNILL